MESSAPESSHRTREADLFVLTDDHIKKINFLDNGTWALFGHGLSDDVKSKLTDSHVIGFLSNPDHIDKQTVNSIDLNDCKNITDDSLTYIVDHFPKLTDLSATNCNISTLPDDIGDKLQHLRRLNLTNNNIKTLPESIGKLERLEKLYLDNNNITAMPASIGILNNLKWLYLDNNIIETLPVSISNLAGTCPHFRIDGNPLQDPPLEIANKGIRAIYEYNSPGPRYLICENRDPRKLRPLMWFTILFALFIFAFASIVVLPEAIQMQRGAYNVGTMTPDWITVGIFYFIGASLCIVSGALYCCSRA